jgi:trehalose 6-phosphate synthase/phosphatase
MAATFRIASSNIIKTAAERRLPSTDSVLTMLKWVERHFANKRPRKVSSNYNPNKKVSSFTNTVGFPLHMSFDLTTSPSRSPRASPLPSPCLSTDSDNEL